MVLIKLNAGNDRNGNPRRVYVGLRDNGDIMGAWDESYSGSGAVPKRYRHKASLAPEFETTPSEYRHLLSRWQK